MAVFAIGLLAGVLSAHAASSPAAAPAPTPTGAVSAETAFKKPVAGTDLTAKFDALYDGPAARAYLSAKQRALLSHYDVFLVPGFLTGYYLQIGKFIEQTIDKKDVLNYLRDAKEALSEIGVKTDQTFLNKEQFNTQASVALNAARIVSAILESAKKGKRVILISHSKGGNDVLLALLTLQRQGKLKSVAGWISVQSGFLGSPVADAIMDNEALRKAAKLFLEELGGTLDSLMDMTSEECKKTLAANSVGIAKLVKAVPILSFASWKPKPEDFQSLHPDTILAKTRDLMAGHGLLNDGLVPTNNAILSGTAYVAKIGVDHAEVAMANQPPVVASRLDRKKFLHVLLSLLLDRMSGPAPRHV